MAKFPDAIKINRIRKCIADDDERSRLTLLTHPGHQNDFESLIIRGIDFESLKKPSKRKISSNVQSRFVNTAFIFKQKLEEIGEDQAGSFISYLFNKVKIIKIKCTNRSFAIKLFQVLNDRGMDLSSSDLIKSYLLSKLPDEKHQQFTADWQAIEQISEDTDMGMDELFTLFEYYKLGSNPKKALSDEITEIFKDTDSNAAINEFKNFCIQYRDEIHDKHEKTLNSLWYLRWSMYWKMIALTGLTTKYDNYPRLLTEMRRFYYLYWMAGKTLTQIKQTSFNVVKWIKDKKPIDDIRAELDKKLKDDNILALVKQNLNGDVYFERWFKPLLLTIEYNYTDDSKANYIELDNKIHVEHVLPKEFAKFSEWGHFSKDDAEAYLHSLGNLTLLSGKKNIEASNNPFETKLEVYKGLGKYKNKKSGYTAFDITQKIIHDQINCWDINEINKRKNWYLENIEQILDIDLNDLKVSNTSKAA